MVESGNNYNHNMQIIDKITFDCLQIFEIPCNVKYIVVVGAGKWREWEEGRELELGLVCKMKKIVCFL